MADGTNVAPVFPGSFKKNIRSVTATELGFASILSVDICDNNSTQYYVEHFSPFIIKEKSGFVSRMYLLRAACSLFSLKYTM